MTTNHSSDCRESGCEGLYWQQHVETATVRVEEKEAGRQITRDGMVGR